MIWKIVDSAVVFKTMQLHLLFNIYLWNNHERKKTVWNYSWCSTYGSHLTISLIFFLFVWIKYLTFYISKVLFLRYLKVLLFYKFVFWNYIYEKVSVRPQGSILKPKARLPVHMLDLLALLNGSFKTHFLSLKNINQLI